MLVRILVICVFLTLPASAQQPFPIVEIDELGHLGPDMDGREFADLEDARAYPEADQGLRIEGRDAQGLPWRAWIPQVGGIGQTRVFRADFDGNGRPDLLFVATFAGNGRCVDGGTVTTLFFEANGRPSPWSSQTHGIGYGEEPPLTLLDLNGDGRAELVTTGCEYANLHGGIGEDHWISGVYEARDSRWVPYHPSVDEPYLEAAKAPFASYTPGYIEWQPAAEPSWHDPLSGWQAPASLRLSGLLSPEIGCAGAIRVELGGTPPADACAESAGKRRARYSDGTVRTGWPWVVVDSPRGRDIYMNDSRAAMEQVLAGAYPLRLLGPEATPRFLWAEPGLSKRAGAVTLRLATTVVHTTPIDLTEQTPKTVQATPPPTILPNPQSPFAGFVLGGVGGAPTVYSAERSGSYFSREGRCFLILSPGGYDHVVPLADCKDLGFLESAALQGDRVLLSFLDAEPKRLSPSRRTLSTVLNLAGLGERITGEIQFQPLAGLPGDVIGAVKMDAGWLVQWSTGGSAWFALHSETGEPVSARMELELEGELFQSRPATGLVFLRWKDGLPVEATVARAALEWVRQP